MKWHVVAAMKLKFTLIGITLAGSRGVFKQGTKLKNNFNGSIVEAHAAINWTVY